MKRMKRAIFLWLLSVGCTGSDKNIMTTNAFPEAIITSHSDGAEILEGIPVLFTGSVSDTNNQVGELLVTWYADTEVLCPEAPPEADASTRCEEAVGAGVSTITLAVRDPDYARADASISIAVVETDVPSAQIISPTSGANFSADELILFEGLLSDGEDSPDTLLAYWSSSIDGELTMVDATPNSYGEITGYGALSVGQHVIELHVEDSSGKTNKDSLLIEVDPENSAPTCEILQPTTGAGGAEGELISFLGQVNDVDVANSELAVVWTSDKDGELGNSIPDMSGMVTFPYDGLSVNTHVVSMTVADDHGEQCVANVIYTVSIANNAPVISALSLTPSTLYTDDILQATVSATDTDLDPLSYQLDWFVDAGSGFSNVQSSSGANNDSLDGVSFFERGDSVYVNATVSDGHTTVSQASSVLVVQNTAPTAFNVVISPVSPVAGVDDLECIAQGSDADGDTVTLSYAWEVDGNSTAHTAAVISAADISDGEVWECIVTPFDGTDLGVTSSASVTVGANMAGATGLGWCAAAGAGVDPAGNQFTLCLAEVGIAGEATTDNASYTLQPGSIFVFSPE